MGKALLPAFGGSYMVWATCMVFFQGFLLLGYVYVHKIQKWLGIIRYSKWHWILILLSFSAFPFRFDRLGEAAINMPAGLAVLWLLFISVGLPFFVLSTISVILQSWLSRSELPEKKNPYVLYSASNLGSLAALLSYPMVFEPLFTIKQQGNIWWACFLCLAALSIFCIPRNTSADMEEMPSAPVSKIAPKDRAVWFLLSAAACMALLAITNMIIYGIASIPFLWILPLVVYLVTFVLAFKRNPWYPEWTRQAFSWIVPLGAVLYLFSSLQLGVPVMPGLVLNLVILFIICTNCNGRLIKIKPARNEELTTFYLMIAFGGFFGSLIVSNIVPLVANQLLEYPLSFALAAFSLAMSEAAPGQKKRFSLLNKGILASSTAIVATLTLAPWALHHIFKLQEKISILFIAIPILLILRAYHKDKRILAALLLIMILAGQFTEELFFDKTKTQRTRNFYGVFCVFEAKGQRYLTNGPTVHGRQYIEGPMAKVPISYYHKTTPAGELLFNKPFRFDSVGMIGLGTGACAAHLGAGQELTIYELNPDNLALAERWFTYLDIGRRNGAKINFAFGDGRVLLRRAKANIFDLLVVDAFNGGSIPLHLLTKEAFAEYFRVLKPDGIILFNISNRIIDFRPVIYSAALSGGFYACEKSNSFNVDKDADLCVWMIACRDKTKYGVLMNDYDWRSSPGEKGLNARTWTDQYTDLISYLQ